MNEEWGPWIEHDGKGLPKHVAGKWVESVERGGLVEQHIAGGVNRGALFCAWKWIGFRAGFEIVRYRVRQPLGLSLLRRIAEYPERERIDA